MLYAKVSPVGIDIPIQKLQTMLHSKLPGIWGIDADQYAAYGRCYRNQKDDGYIPEVYVGNGEYKEVYVDDRISAISFFGLSGDIDYDMANTAQVHLIFFVSIPKLKSVAHRGDEEVRLDVQKLVKNKSFGFNLERVRLGIENVFEEYAGTTIAQRENIGGIKYRDMHPLHCFRFDFSLLYNINNCK